MKSTTMDERGRTTVPQELREVNGIEDGEKANVRWQWDEDEERVVADVSPVDQ